MQTRIQETSAIWFQHFLGRKKWHFRSWHCLVHLNSTADQHLGLVLHTLASLSVIYIQKQLHWLAGSAKKKKKLKRIQPSQPSPGTSEPNSRKRRTLPLAKHVGGSQQSPAKVYPEPNCTRHFNSQSPKSHIYRANSTQFLQGKTNQISCERESCCKTSRFNASPASQGSILEPDLTLSSHTLNTFQEPVSFWFSWTFFKDVFLMHLGELWLSTQKSPQGTCDPLDFKDPQPVVVLSDLHSRDRHNFTSWILGGNSTSLPSK